MREPELNAGRSDEPMRCRCMSGAGTAWEWERCWISQAQPAETGETDKMHRTRRAGGNRITTGKQTEPAQSNSVGGLISRNIFILKQHWRCAAKSEKCLQ